MSDNFNMYDQANQQGNPNIPPMPPMEEKKGIVNCIYGTWYYRSGILVYSNPWRTYWYCRTYPRYRRRGKRVEGALATAGIVMSIITIVLAVINAIAGVYLQTSNVLNQL